MSEPAPTIRYPESKERSAELLRLALVRMSAHDAALNPLTFAVWYEHLGGGNAELSRAFEVAHRDDPRMGDRTVQRLHEKHVIAARERAAEEVGDGLERLMHRMARAATETGAQAGQFHNTLENLTQVLRENDSADIAAEVERAQSHSARMSESLQTLRRELADSRNEAVRLRAELRSLRSEAMTCALTGVLNRKGFDERLAAMLAQPFTAGQEHVMVLLDVDHFKRVNDTHGHVLGDRVLEAIGRLLRERVTAEGASVARYGGEEFAILLPGMGLARAAEVTEAVRSDVSRIKLRQRATDREVLRVTASAGVAAARSADQPTELVQRADSALYAAKQGGRDRTVVSHERAVPAIAG
ncbi:MAG: GGDEF domain-containing protein [Betaproteobacteria bacterium]|nr:GGDEF domain-containing protein [Betaproteobacteria bacterium]MCC6247816.1 GGDEF domain-containing protein [Rubrivivax sp.]